MSGAFAEQMDDDVDVVDQDPGVGAVPGMGDGFLAEGGGEFLDVVADGLHLSWAGAGGDDEEISDWGDVADVKDDDVVAAGIGGEACDVEGEFSGGVDLVGGGVLRMHDVGVPPKERSIVRRDYSWGGGGMRQQRGQRAEIGGQETFERF